MRANILILIFYLEPLSFDDCACEEEHKKREKGKGGGGGGGGGVDETEEEAGQCTYLQ